MYYQQLVENEFSRTAARSRHILIAKNCKSIYQSVLGCASYSGRCSMHSECSRKFTNEQTRDHFAEVDILGLMEGF